MSDAHTFIWMAVALMLATACVRERGASSAEHAVDSAPAIDASQVTSTVPQPATDTLSATAPFRCGLPRHLPCADSVYLAFFDQTAASLVAGYRLPAPPDFGETWSAYASFIYKTRDDSDRAKAPYWTKGDFNGDGATDFAYILIRSSDSAKVLFAFLSNAGRYRAITLDEDIDQEMGLATQGPGTFTTASGKGYWHTTREDPGSVHVAKYAIAFFMFEGASSLFVWDPSKKAFVRVWMSD